MAWAPGYASRAPTPDVWGSLWVPRQLPQDTPSPQGPASTYPSLGQPAMLQITVIFSQPREKATLLDGVLYLT